MSQQCWGVTAGQAPHNSSNVGVVTAGQVGHNSSYTNRIRKATRLTGVVVSLCDIYSSLLSINMPIILIMV